ncbi:MAG: glycoside hydrolase family 20 zincin-like fold domain-containing protein [Acidobacteriota bacterium]
MVKLFSPFAIRGLVMPKSAVSHRMIPPSVFLGPLLPFIVVWWLFQSPFYCCAASAPQADSELFQRGYYVVPSPQQAILRKAEFQFGSDWRLLLGAGIRSDNVAVEVLKDELQVRCRVRLQESSISSASPELVLEIHPGTVVIGRALDRERAVLERQAYRMELTPRRIRILANHSTGLLYGVETLIQLVKAEGGSFLLPEGEIIDWPDLQLRLIFWDDAHHVERIEAFKRIIRQAAFFKINAIALKLEGHFQFKGVPALVEPYAWTAKDLQELTDYGLRYHLQLIPWLDGPGHVAFILKHPEYAHLRAFPDSNYELCTTNPASTELLVGMFNELIDANQGVDYIYFSTDEPYYVGLADNPQCSEVARAKELGSNGRLLADFIARVADPLRARGRRVVFMGEYPLEPGDIEVLPSYLISTVVNGPRFDPLYRARGIRQMLHTSTQGEEELFPSYFVLPQDRRLHQLERQALPRVQEGFEMISTHSARKQADILGTITAGWGDAGLHPETFWLGYAAITAAGWRPTMPEPVEIMRSFLGSFYGFGTHQIERIYELMSHQAQFWADSWEHTHSVARKPLFGSSRRIFIPREPAQDFTIDLPETPAPDDLAYSYPWTWANRKRLELVAHFRKENDELVGLLDKNLETVQLNRYNLEVFLSIARIYGQNLELLSGLSRVDEFLKAAWQASRRGNGRAAVSSLDGALDQVQSIRRQRNAVLQFAERTWYMTWQPRVPSANGRHFFHQLDDVKDHEPDRTVDLSYLVYRQLLLPFDEWFERVHSVRNAYADRHGLPRRRDSLDWNSLAADQEPRKER